MAVHLQIRQANLQHCKEATAVADHQFKAVQCIGLIQEPYCIDNKITDEMFAGVPVRVYEPRSTVGREGLMPGIIFVHGGGFVLMNTDSYESTLREISRMSRMVIISIEYRLAPEHLFPAGIQDCMNASRHFHEIAASRFAVDPDRIAILGDSAGGNLATVTARKLREDYGIHVKAQAMIYPLLQYLDLRTPSYQLQKSYAGASLPDPPSIARWMLLYLGLDHRLAALVEQNQHVHPETMALVEHHLDHGDLPSGFHHDLYALENRSTAAILDQAMHGDLHKLQSFMLDPDFCPLILPDVSSQPTTFIATTEYDILRDEGYWYARRLRAAGIQTHYQHYPTGFHGVLNFYHDIDVAKQIVVDLVDFLILAL